MSNYVKTVHVRYNDSNGSLGNQDINSGFGGEYVYLVPEYTSNIHEAAFAFSLLTTYNADINAADVSKGDGKDLFRYIRTLYRHDKSQVITNVWLARGTPGGDGHTDDINKDRGGDFLYLCWEYGRGPASVPIPEIISFVKAPGWIPDALAPGQVVKTACDSGEYPTKKVPIGALVFSQNDISGTFRDGQDVRSLIAKLRELSIEDRQVFIGLLPPIPVVTISVPNTNVEYLLALDNRMLSVFRSVLPPDVEVTIQPASGKEREKIMQKWTSKFEGLLISIRGKE